jgi:hypothetical protein
VEIHVVARKGVAITANRLKIPRTALVAARAALTPAAAVGPASAAVCVVVCGASREKTRVELVEPEAAQHGGNFASFQSLNVDLGGGFHVAAKVPPFDAIWAHR